MLEQEKSPFTVSLEDDSGYLMLQASNLWAHYQDKALKRHYGLSHVQFSVLASISWQVLEEKKQATQTMLAEQTKISPMTISQMLKVLETRGYVYRTKHLTDVRAKAVDLTQEGKELTNKAMKTIYSIDAKFFRILGKNIKCFNRYMFELLKAND